MNLMKRLYDKFIVEFEEHISLSENILTFNDNDHTLQIKFNEKQDSIIVRTRFIDYMPDAQSTRLNKLRNTLYMFFGLSKSVEMNATNGNFYSEYFAWDNAENELERLILSI